MANDELALFSLDSGRDFAALVAACLGIDVGHHEERDFEDGEHKIRPLQSVRNRDVYVVQSLYGDENHSLNDQLVRLLFFLGVLRESGAARVTAVIPYLCYSRKERKTKTRDPVTTRYVAQLFEAMGVERVVTVDVHNRAGFQNAFRCRSEHLSARGPFIDWLLPHLHGKDVAVASPDVGGVKRAELFREALERRLDKPTSNAFMEKRRSEGVVTGSQVVGEVENRTVVIVDDLIAGGGTMKRAAEAFLDRGAREVIALASHGIFAAQAAEGLSSAALSRVAVTNSIPPNRLPDSLYRQKVDVIDISPLIGDAIRRLHEGGSLSELEP
jgi:ribose-phosphate pyrophosphokinase